MVVYYVKLFVFVLVTCAVGQGVEGSGRVNVINFDARKALPVSVRAILCALWMATGIHASR